MFSTQNPIVLLGAGNLGYHLGKRLSEVGAPLAQVFSRQPEKARALSEETGAQPVYRMQSISPSAGLYILAVSDDAIAPVAEQLARFLSGDKAVVHTSGATPSTVLQPHFQNYGVFYPLQTFSRNKAVNFSSIPVCIYSPEKALEVQLQTLAQQLSEQVYRIDDEERAVLHVAAVFVNNFTNYLYQAGHQIVKEKGLPFEMLLPLIRETADKIEQASPEAMQTGPARRGDRKTIAQHLEYLEKFPKFEAIYRLLSDNISEQYQKE